MSQMVNSPFMKENITRLGNSSEKLINCILMKKPKFKSKKLENFEIKKYGNSSLEVIVSMGFNAL